MLDSSDNHTLPEIPAKRYFTIGEVSKLCRLKPHVLRYWEQEFRQLNPVKRRGNRRYYQRHEVELIRRIRELLYVDGFTINGARLQVEQQLEDGSLNFKDIAGEKGRTAGNNHQANNKSGKDNSDNNRTNDSGEPQAILEDTKDSSKPSRTELVEEVDNLQSMSASSTVANTDGKKRLESLLAELKNLRSTLEN